MPGKIMQKKILVWLLVFCSMEFSAFASLKEYPWVLKKNTDGIRVSVRKVEGSSFLEYSGIVAVDTGLEEVVRLYEEKEDGRMPEWFLHCKEVRLIETRSPEDKTYYFVLSMPIPFQDRDLVYRRIRTTDPVAGVVEYRVKELSGIFPQQHNRVRMLSSTAYWRLRRVGKERTEVYYQQHSELGGVLPAWLVNVLAVNIPFHTLTNFRRLLMEEKNNGVPEI
jgi:START domain